MRGFLRVGVVVACLAVAGSLTLAQQSDVRMVAVEGEGAKYWPVWRGPSGQGLVDRHVSRHVVGDRKRRLEKTGAGPRQLVADRVGRQNLSDDGA